MIRAMNVAWLSVIIVLGTTSLIQAAPHFRMYNQQKIFFGKEIKFSFSQWPSFAGVAFYNLSLGYSISEGTEILPLAIWNQSLSSFVVHEPENRESPYFRRVVVVSDKVIDILNTDLEDNNRAFWMQMFYRMTESTIIYPFKVKRQYPVFAAAQKISPLLPKSVRVILGNNVELPCTFRGIPMATVTWITVPPANNSQTTPQYDTVPHLFGFTISRRELHVINAQFINEGYYRCQGRNDYGTSIQEMKLDILVPPTPISPIPLQQRELEAGQNLAITCVFEGLPISEFTWIDASTRGVSGQKYDIYNVNNGTTISTQHFTVSNIQVNESGVYKCIAKNIAGESNHWITVEVKGSPHFDPSVMPDRLPRCIGEETMIKCATWAHPIPTMNISKDSIILSTIESNTASYIETTNNSTFGKFTCAATNALGNDTRTISVVQRDNYSPPVGMRVTTGSLPRSIEIFWKKPFCELEPGIMAYIINVTSLKTKKQVRYSVTCEKVECSHIIQNLDTNSTYKVSMAAMGNDGNIGEMTGWMISPATYDHHSSPTCSDKSYEVEIGSSLGFVIIALIIVICLMLLCIRKLSKKIKVLRASQRSQQKVKPESRDPRLPYMELDNRKLKVITPENKEEGYQNPATDNVENPVRCETVMSPEQFYESVYEPQENQTSI